ncbi:MAG: L-fucose isomerase [Candidatus Caldatribacteriota bacterium]
MKFETRLIGALPRVGIRPIIDGRRRGVRESLEEQTMRMAERAAQLISLHLRHPNGLPVECVIADTTIGGAAEAARCADKFARSNVRVSLSVTPCWCYGMETIDLDPYLPKAIWGFNGTERPGAVYLAAALAGHDQLGLPAFGIYGREVKDANDESIPEDVQEKILQFVKAGLAVALMKGKSYLSLGSVSMGIAGSVINPEFLKDYLGMRTEFVDMSEFVRRMEEGIYDQKEYQQALAWVKQYCKEGKDRNKEEIRHSRQQKDREWEIVVKMTLIARDLMIGNQKLAELGYSEEAEGHNAIAAGFQGQRQWTDHFPNGDFMETILNTSFDWNGVREPFIFATENDCLNGIAMLWNHLLTNRAQMFSDVRTFWSPESVKRVTGKELIGKAANGIIHLINSGATTLDATGQQKENGLSVMKQFWEINKQDIKACLENTRWSPASLEYFRGGGFSSTFWTRGEMPVTMSRINLIKGLGPVLQIAEGYTVELPDDISYILTERTDPTWPTTWFAPRITGKGAFTDVYSVMNFWGANHGAISYGHIGKDLITLASILRIPVAMHNVPEEKIFRPKAWSAFGTENLESADFRACRNFGPLYK